MADKTGISWTESTWNPVVGCSIESPACTNCYAMAQADRIIRMAHGAGKSTHYEGTVASVKGKAVWTGRLARAHVGIFEQPLRWSRPRFIFVNSMSDVFHPDMPWEWIDDILAVAANASRHVFQILTKRPAVMRAYICDPQTEDRVRSKAVAMGLSANDFSWPLANVWMGCTVEDQKRADERVDELRHVPAAVRFLSVEPMLSAVDLRRVRAVAGGVVDALTGPNRIDWVVVGGESGPRARPTNPSWVRGVRQACEDTGTMFFFKQWGAWFPAELMDLVPTVNSEKFDRREIDGGQVMLRSARRIDDLDDVLDGRRHADRPTGMAIAA